MFKMPEMITYALPEQIGNYDLFVGRNKELDYFLEDWFHFLIQNMALSQALVARRKKGKTAFLQRLFNLLWSSPDTNVVPFYFNIQEMDTSLAYFSKEFFTIFVNHFISYRTRKPGLVSNPLNFERLREIIEDKELRSIYDSMEHFDAKGNWEEMWGIASKLPSELAYANHCKVVQILDEFQNINAYIYNREGRRIENVSGTYLQLAERREAPLIVTGSEVHGLMKIVLNLTGRFQERALENLPEEEAKEAIRRYAKAARTKINEESEDKIWNLTQGDPLYIRALTMSAYNTTKDYTNEENIVSTYAKEITDGEIHDTWLEYISKVFVEVNERHAKRIMLYLFQRGEERTRAQIIEDLKLDMTDFELEKKHQQLIKADLISRGRSYFDYQIAKDKTYELVFRSIYQKEIDNFVPNLKTEIRREMGKTNYEKGKFQEFLVREKLKKPFNMKDLVENGADYIIEPKALLERETVKIGLRNREIDLIVQGNTELWIDIKDTKGKYGRREAERWIEIRESRLLKSSKTLFAVYSRQGYTARALKLLRENSVMVMKSEPS